MWKLTCFTLFLLATTGPNFAFGQTDSIQLRIRTSSGLERAKAYYDAVYFYLRGNVPMAKKTIQECDLFAQQENDKVISSYSILNHGLLHSALGQLDSAIFYLEKAKTLASTQEKNDVIVKINSSLGKAYISAGKAKLGLKCLYEALDFLTEKPQPETEIKVRINICWALLELKRYRDCVDYGIKSLPQVGKPYEWMLPYFYNNIAVSYGALKKIDSAKILVEKSIAIAKPTKQFGMLANAHFILGTIYSADEKYDLAVKEFLNAKPYREEIGDPFFIVSDLYTISDLYYRMKQFRKGIESAQEALRIANDNQLTLKFEGIYLTLAKNYEGLGDFKNSSLYYNLLSTAKDSVYKHASADAIAEMREKYETEKKNRQIIELNTKNELQTAVIERNTIFIIALIFVVVLIAIVFYLWRKRQLHQQEIVMQEQKMRMREAQISAVIDSQEKERTRFATDLHDGIGQLVSALQINVQSLKQNKAEFELRDKLFTNSEQLLNDIYQEIKNIAFNLMPPILVKEGLLPSVRELVRKVNQAGKIKCTVTAFDFEGRFAEAAEISLYRIIQELISNMIKYSTATEATLSFTGYSNEVVLTIDDNGMGYDVGKFKNSSGNGWSNIKSRLNLIKASVEFDIEPNRKNNLITITIPRQSLIKDAEALKLENTNPSV